VPIAEISTNAAVKQARKNYARAKTRERYYL